VGASRCAPDVNLAIMTEIRQRLSEDQTIEDGSAEDGALFKRILNRVKIELTSYGYTRGQCIKILNYVFAKLLPVQIRVEQDHSCC
jgi:hypothetical protein